MNTVLIVGGYGQFGGRLSRRLSGLENLELMVGGRSHAKAEAFCKEQGGNLKPAVFDRDGDIQNQLNKLKPDIMVDASGPFQNVFGTGYNLPRICASMGVHYIDLSDSGTYTQGITTLDSEAKRTKTAIISGASSVPALSAAVVIAARKHFSTINSIEGGISPGGKINIGLSVTKAVLSYLGKPLKVFCGGEWTEETGFSRQHKRTVAIEGKKPVVRRYGLCDAPDLLLFPDLFPGVETVRFHGSTELGLIHSTLRALAWLQRRGLVRNLQNQARFYAWAGTQLGRFASDRGCMYMSVAGYDAAGMPIKLDWNLIASDGDGPYIPALAAEILIKRWLNSSPEPGARSAAGEIELAEFDALFDTLSIKSGFSKPETTPFLFQEALGDKFIELPAPIREGHSVFITKTLRGRVDVERGKNRIANLIANCFQFSKTCSNAPILMTMDRKDDTEIWMREIDGNSFRSTLSAGARPGEIFERFGQVKFKIHLRPETGKLHYDIVSARFFGIPLPLPLLPRSNTHERVEGGKFVFDVDITLPLFGRLISYKGWLT